MVEKEYEPVRKERLAPGDKYCPRQMFGLRDKPVCDTGSLFDVQYIFILKSWTLTFGTTMCS